MSSIKFSGTGKMPCFSWSLEAFTTCAGAVDIVTGKVVDACEICYARGGFYAMKAAKALREHNKKDWKRPEFVPEFIVKLDNSRYFRWFDSGDCYTVKLAWKMYAIMKDTPWCKHWFPTRNHKFDKYKEVHDAMALLPNVVVRFSSDSITGGLVDGATTSTIVPYVETPVDFTGKSEIYMSSHYEKITKRLNGARSGKSASVSVILAKPFFNTQQEAQEQLPPKLKLEN